MSTSSGARSSQGDAVQKELEILRQKHLAKNQRDKLKDVCSAPLTTPEEARRFLQSMREKTHEREFSHQPPSNLSSAGMDAWFYQQRQREQELRQRRAEAEALLRGYRGGRESLPSAALLHSARHHGGGNSAHGGGGRESMGFYGGAAGAAAGLAESGGGGGKISVDTSGFPQRQQSHSSLRSTASGGGASESLDDPRSFFNRHRESPQQSAALKQQQQQQQRELEEEKKSADLRDGGAPPDPSADAALLLTNASTSDSVSATNNNNSHAATSPPPSSAEGAVEPTVWLDFISSEPGAKFPPAAGRYHLYLSYACPGSHRALIVRALKGLEAAVSVTYVHPTWRLTGRDDPADKHRGWVFGDPNGEPFSNTIHRGGPFPPAYPGNEPDPIFHAYSVREVYQQAGDTSGKYTIPLLWDKETGTIVNNESSDIAYMLNSSFNEFAINPDLDLYTEYDQEGMAKLNEVSDWLSPLMIHGVYRCGFAKNQRAYDKAIADLCEAFDRADDILQQQRYLTGNDVLTDADIRLFCSLLRFDEVYSIYFKANARLVMLTPALLNFCREIYQIDGVAATCNMEQIKAHFFGSHAEWNKYSVIPRGLGFIELLDMPHDRHLLTDGDDSGYEIEQAAAAPQDNDAS